MLIVGMNTRRRVVEALRNSGYTLTGILSAQFKGYGNRNEMHRITFHGEDGEVDEGTVYIVVRDGRPYGDF